MPLPILQTFHLNKFYHKPVEFQALKDITLEIHEGEFIAIVGPSGSGKSTLLYVLSTMDTDYTGEIYFAGELLKNKSARDLAQLRNEHIGFVFQFHYLLPEFTVLENVMLPALKLNHSLKQEIEKEALNILEMLNLSGIAYKKANQLSGGQQQRVAIARALINKPKIIMGDEPTGNLDSKNATLVYQIFRELNQKQGQTFLIVTHDNHFAAQADKIITLKDGCIIN
ncbi:MAG: ABC transporter ATP-binding protein [Bacteroidia bacterium]|nr:ABC transporter ATP-binding protein [Bacteroidia bacterium]MDW8157820.1 ABC transporter ATP-binding protein [Bacteroidia bacterium]